MKRALRIVFGAHGQLAVGVGVFVAVIGAWVYGSGLRGEPLLRFIFHASMATLVIAAYSIIATALGYRATERVEAKVVETIERADEVHTGEVGEMRSSSRPA